MSYSAAGAVAPAGGTAAGYANYRALFDSIFATFNADDAIIAAATSTGSLANAGKLAKFAGDGGLTLAGAFGAVNGAFSGTLNATGNTALGGTLAVAGTIASGALNAVSAAGATPSGAFRGAAGDPAQIVFQVTNNAQNVSYFSVDNSGAGVLRGGLTATTGAFSGAVSAVGAVTAPAFHGVADTAASVAPGRATAAGTLTLTFAAYDYWNATAGQWINYPGGAYTYGAGGNLAVPGVTIYRYDLFYYDTSGTLVAVAGANGSDLATAYTNRPPLPLNAHPAAYAVLRPLTTVINQTDSGVAGTGYLRDARDPFSAPYISAAAGATTAILQNTGQVAVNSDGSISIAAAATKHVGITSDLAFTGGAKFTMASGTYTAGNTPPMLVLSTGSSLDAAHNTGAATGFGNRSALWGFVDNADGNIDTTVIRVDQTQSTNPLSGAIAKTGILVNSFTQPDNGGDTSAFLGVQTGGGSALTVYKVAALRPPGFADYSSSPGVAIEAGSDGGSAAILAESGAVWGGTAALNPLVTTTTGAMLTTDTTIPVASTLGYPNSGWLRIQNVAQTLIEDVSFTGKTTTTFTGVGRSYALDTAQAWASGSQVVPIIPNQAVWARVQNGCAEGFLVNPNNGQFDGNRNAFIVGTKNFSFTSTNERFMVKMSGATTIRGPAQATAAAVVTSAAQPASLSLLDTNGPTAGAGGILQFGIGTYQMFGAIRGALFDNTANSTGDLQFATRALSGDTTLTERMRITPLGVKVGTTGAVAVLKCRQSVFATMSFGTIANGAQSTLAVAGFSSLSLANTDVAQAAINAAMPTGCIISAAVVSATTVNVTIVNFSGASQTLNVLGRVMVDQF